MTWSDLTSATKAAVVLAALGFVLSFSSYSSSNLNGVTSCSFIDYGALIFGVLAVLVAGFGEISALTSPETEAKMPNLVLCAIAGLIGIFHILRGIGFIGGPCN